MAHDRLIFAPMALSTFITDQRKIMPDPLIETVLPGMHLTHQKLGKFRQALVHPLIS